MSIILERTPTDSHVSTTGEWASIRTTTIKDIRANRGIMDIQEPQGQFPWFHHTTPQAIYQVEVEVAEGECPLTTQNSSIVESTKYSIRSRHTP